MKLKHRRTKEPLCQDNWDVVELELHPGGLNREPHSSYRHPHTLGFWVKSELKEGVSVRDKEYQQAGQGFRGSRDKFSLGCDEFEMLLGYHEEYSVEQGVNETGA